MRSTLPTFNEVWQRKLRSDILSTEKQYFSQNTFLVACSGGMDSMLLLHVMCVLFPKRVRAIYIDHQLQQTSHQWGKTVAAVCSQRDVPCVLASVKVEQGNLEQQARIARYQAFSQHLQPKEILVLAHHQQDQAETLILRLFSGTGVSGLCAMKAIDQREQYSIWRPLLNFSREHIESWMSTVGDYIDDPTNLDTHYDRAWARAKLWPLLQERFPKMQDAIGRTAFLMQDAQEILQDVLQQDLKHCVQDNWINLEKLKSLSDARRRQLLSSWIKGQQANYRPSLDTIQRLEKEVIQARPDAQAHLYVKPNWYVRYQNRLYKIERTIYESKYHINFNEIKNIRFYAQQQFDVACGTFKIESYQTWGLAQQLLETELTVVFRQGGERVYLHGRAGTWPLKKAIQEAQILPWRRHEIQLLQKDDTVLGIFTPHGFWLTQSPYCVKDGWLPQKID